MLKKYGFLIIMIVLVVGLLVAVFNKDSIYNYISHQMQESVSEETQFESAKYIQQHFNYIENSEDFDFTLLEFKSQGCTICKQMEPVLKAVKSWDGAKINVQVIQIMNSDSQELMKYFGISAVPTHIILDKKGSEVFRKYGFISEDELKSQIISEL